MNTLTITATDAANAPTMSSREIAELCGKRHDNVVRDIEKMLREIIDLKFEANEFLSSYKDSIGRTLKEYRLPKDLTVTLVTGYRADLRYKVVKRLEELESLNQPIELTGPQLMAKALLEADETLKAQALQIEHMREDVEAHAQLVKAEGTLNITDAAKNLGMQPKALFNWMDSNQWIYKRAYHKNWLAYQTKCDQGLLLVKTTVVSLAGCHQRIREQVRVTAKGLSRLAKDLRQTQTT